jgi:hypothetical protein
MAKRDVPAEVEKTLDECREKFHPKFPPFASVKVRMDGWEKDKARPGSGYAARPLSKQETEQARSIWQTRKDEWKSERRAARQARLQSLLTPNA